jgi:hypothetical protein
MLPFQCFCNTLYVIKLIVGQKWDLKVICLLEEAELKDDFQRDKPLSNVLTLLTWEQNMNHNFSCFKMIQWSEKLQCVSQNDSTLILHKSASAVYKFVIIHRIIFSYIISNLIIGSSVSSFTQSAPDRKWIWYRARSFVVSLLNYFQQKEHIRATIYFFNLFLVETFEGLAECALEWCWKCTNQSIVVNSPENLFYNMYRFYLHL